MTQGILIYAHNTRAVDYALLAVISAGLAKKHLSMPATLVTDDSTISWMKQSQLFEIANTVFENINDNLYKSKRNVFFED
jgi:repressor of nif and glnA expression